MTVVSVIFTPLVIAYQAWSCHVFRGRIKGPAAEPTGGAAFGAVQLASDQPGDGAGS
jgi:hypothetical protein